MVCECESLPRIINLETYPNHLMDGLELIDEKDSGWRKLYRCGVDGCYWQVDVIDRLQTNCAIRIDDVSGWRTFDDKPVRLQYLIEARGGLTQDECIMAGCKNKTLKTLAYCPTHAYETVGLRE